MEGILWKWTNYWNGWQTRWFILDGSTGVLSYYKSSEEVNQGCKGSVKVNVCQINVHSVDKSRLDLVIPGEQHMYLRAPSPQERQKWLVALGSTKACVMNLADVKKYEHDDPNSIHHKKSELKLYCDLLTQQVHDIKSGARANNDDPERKAMEEAASLLTATCDTFIKTLEEVMAMSKSFAISAQNSDPYEMVIPTTSLPKHTVPPIGTTKNMLESSNISLNNTKRSTSQENR